MAEITTVAEVAEKKEGIEGVEISSLKLNVVRRNGVLTANFKALEGALDKKLDEYRLVQYADDADKKKKQLKEDRKDLNQLSSALKAQKKEVKEEFMKPLNDFEDGMNRLLKLVEEPKLVIDDKIKELEDAEREHKRAQIQGFWEKISGGYADDFLDDLYKKIYVASWENTSTTQKTYKEALQKGLDNYIHGMQCLRISNHEFMDDAIREFKLTLDLQKAIDLMEEKKKQKEELLKKEEERLAAERLRIEREAKEKAEAEAKAKLEAERLRIEAEARVKAEAEAKAKMEAERALLEAETKKKAEEEAKKVKTTPAPATSQATRGNAQVYTPTHVSPTPVQAASTGTDFVTVMFHASEWKAVQRYADRLGVQYKVK